MNEPEEQAAFEKADAGIKDSYATAFEKMQSIEDPVLKNVLSLLWSDCQFLIRRDLASVCGQKDKLTELFRRVKALEQKHSAVKATLGFLDADEVQKLREILYSYQTVEGK